MLEVICGPMFAGKTEEFIRRVKKVKFKYSRKTIKVFKPKLDNRYDSVNIVSHNKTNLESIVIEKSSDLNEFIKANNTPDVIAIEEVQFLDDGIIPIIKNLISRNIRVIVSGLELDSFGNPFGPMPELLCLADDILKLKAICSCGENATRTFRKSKNNDVIFVSDDSGYEPRCVNCWLDY